MSEPTDQTEPRIVQTARTVFGLAGNYPVITLAIVTVIFYVSMFGVPAVLTSLRHSRENRAVEKSQNKSAAAGAAKDEQIHQADEAASKRSSEDNYRERTIKPGIELSQRRLETARAAKRKAADEYEKAKNNPQLPNLDPDALEQLNCSDLRELYPTETDLCP